MGSAARLVILNATALFVLSVLAAPARGYSSFKSEIPNGSRVFRNGQKWGGVGHHKFVKLFPRICLRAP